MPENQELPAPSILASDEAELLQHGKVRPPTQLGSCGRVGKFEIIKLIGQGGMGHVYAATEPVTGTTVALKMLKNEFLEDPRVAQIFLREARHMYQLSHPSILKVLEVSSPDEGPFFVMPLMSAGSLAKRISEEGIIDYGDTRTICIQVAEGLAHAHSKGLIHRDLKPANVLLDDAGRALITDFGLVRSYLGDSMVNADRSAPEGTPAYMSPSVAAGQAEDTRCDIYAFGAMLYEMLAGHAPYLGRDAASVMQAVLNGPPEPIAAVNPKAPKSLVAITGWCMARELRDRYASMEDVLTDLQRVQVGKSPRGPHGSAITATPPRRLLLGAAMLALLLAGAYGVVRLAGCAGGSTEARCAKAAKDLATGNGALAERAYISILKEQPDHTQALLGLAEVVKDREGFRRAIAIYRQIMTTSPNSDEAREGIVRVQLHLGHFGPARIELTRWLHIDTENETAKQLLAELDEKEGKHGEAPPAQQEGAQPPTRPFGRPPQDEAQPRPNLDGRPPREGAPPGRAFGGRPRPPRRMPDSEGSEQ